MHTSLSSPPAAPQPPEALPAEEQHVLTFPTENFPTSLPAQPDVKPDVDAFDLRRAEKRARWQARRAELRQLREAKKKEREHEQLVIDKKRHEQEFSRRYRRERYLAAKPKPEPPEDILSWLPSMFRPQPEAIRRRAEFNARRRRMQKTMRRPPLRKLSCRSPNRDELLSAAIAILYEHDRPNRNLLRTVRWMHGDLPDSALPENIRAKHRPAANNIRRQVREELSSRLRADSISCRRTLRRGRVLMQNRNYRWTRFPTAGAAGLDNLGRPAGEPAKMYDPFCGLEDIHPRIVGFEAAIGFPGRLAMLRRIVGLENVRGPEEARKISSASRANAGSDPVSRRAYLSNDLKSDLSGDARNRLNYALKNDLRNSFSNSANGGVNYCLRNNLKKSGQLPGLRLLRRGFVFPFARRRFVLPVSSAGPPVILFPGEEEKEVLLCFPGGGLRAGWTMSPFPRMLLRAG